MTPPWMSVSHEIIKLISIHANNSKSRYRIPYISAIVVSDEPLPKNSMAGGHLWGWDWVWDANDDGALRLYANSEGVDTGYEVRFRG